MNNEELLKKDLAIIIRLASEILLKDDLNIKDVVTQNELENTLKIKQLLTVVDNATNMEIPF